MRDARRPVEPASPSRRARAARPPALTPMHASLRALARRPRPAAEGARRTSPRCSPSRRATTSSGCAQNATRGDVDHARWELRYARRALGLIAAQRDALDDRTASVVARELAEAFAQRSEHRRRHDARPPSGSSTRGSSAYRDGLASRGRRAGADAIGQTLFAFAGGQLRARRPEHRPRRRAAVDVPRRGERGAARELRRGRASRERPAVAHRALAIGAVRKRNAPGDASDASECRRGDSNPHGLAPTGS